MITYGYYIGMLSSDNRNIYTVGIRQSLIIDLDRINSNIDKEFLKNERD